MEKTKESEQKEGSVVLRRSVPGLTSMERALGRMVEDVTGRPWGSPWFGLERPWRLGFLEGQETRIPALEIVEEKDDMVIKAELPGMKKEDVEVRLADNLLTIKGEKRQEEEIKKKGYYYCDRSFGSFERSIEIPREVQSDKGRASFKDGVLEIRLPKTEAAKKKEVKLKVD